MAAVEKNTILERTATYSLYREIQWEMINFVVRGTGDKLLRRIVVIRPQLYTIPITKVFVE